MIIVGLAFLRRGGIYLAQICFLKLYHLYAMVIPCRDTYENKCDMIKQNEFLVTAIDCTLFLQTSENDDISGTKRPSFMQISAKWGL